MIQASNNRRRAQRARREVAAFEPSCEEHQRLKRLVIAMLDFMLLVLCRPEWRSDFERAWEVVEYFRAQLEAPPESAGSAGVPPAPECEPRLAS